MMTDILNWKELPLPDKGWQAKGKGGLYMIEPYIAYRVKIDGQAQATDPDPDNIVDAKWACEFAEECWEGEESWEVKE